MQDTNPASYSIPTYTRVSIGIRQLRYGVTTADAQSFWRAAATLRVKKSTLSLKALALEDSL
jgi:DNA-binding transcriptional LysR family regulator